MTFCLTSFALGTVFGFAIGALVLIGIGMWLDNGDRKRQRQQAMDAACNELERGKA